MEQIKEYEYVDLGLPSGLKWAKCNVGATHETDYGYYFQWGDIEDKSNANCDWSSYKHGDGSNFSKYNPVLNGYIGTIDGKVILDLDDDAAKAYMGSDWRMPTKNEIQELIDNTDSEWATINGINGRKFTSRIDTSKYIFIPASGYRLGSSFRGQGRGGDIWSSSLNTVLPGGALELGFSSGTIYMGDSARYYGLVVRGVMD